MKKIFLIVLPLCIAVSSSVGCGEKEDTSIIHLRGSKWKLAGYVDDSNLLHSLEPRNCEQCYTIVFQTDSTGSGQSSSNQIGVNLNEAPFLYILTMVGEIEDGRYFYDVTNEITSYTHNNDELKFFYQIDNKNYYLLYKFIGYEQE